MLWFGSTAIASKCCKPHTLLAGVVIHEVVRAGRAIQCSGGGVGRIVNVYPAPDSLSVADDGYLLLTHLLTHVAVGNEPGTGSIEESVAKVNDLQLGSAEG